MREWKKWNFLASWQLASWLLAGCLLAGWTSTATAQEAPAQPPEVVDVLLVGDSITDFWDNEGMPILKEYFGFRRYLNIGISGDGTADTLVRLAQPRVANIAPKTIMLMIGTNDIGWKKLSAETAIDGNRKILETLRSRWPNAKILHLAVFPRGDKAEYQPKIDAINAAIKGMADNEHIFFLDINANFLDQEGKTNKTLLPDLLHPNCAGYRLWAEAVEPTLSGWLGGIAVKPAERLNTEWWKSRFEKNKADFKNQDTGLILLGDSITHNWDRDAALYQKSFGAYQPANWGFSGDRTEHVLWRLDNIGDGKTAPKAIMLMIGTNNIGHDSTTPDETIEGIHAILRRIEKKWPETRVLLLPVFPRGADTQDLRWQQVAQINARMTSLADGKRVVFLDFNAKFLSPDGKMLPKEIMPDLLHPNTRGNEIWAESVAPALQELMK